MAGLSAAVTFAEAGWQTVIHEAGPAAGGRCRSYHDRALGCRIDNGNHLLLSGNDAAMAYIDRIGARATLHSPAGAVFPFMDLGTGERWTLNLGSGRIPWWVLRASSRVPGTRLADYAQLLRLRRAAAEATVADVLDRESALYRRLLEPLAIAALNTPCDTGLASLLQAVVAGSLGRGGAACIPMLPRDGLSETLVDPAVTWLAARGGELHTGHRVAALTVADGAVTALGTPDGPVPIAPGEVVVLAVPAWVAVELLPGLVVPDAHEAILNIHFRMPNPNSEAGFIGLVGGTAEWVFTKKQTVSVTVSAANRLVDLPAEEIAARVWPDVCAALGLAGSMPPMRVVKEKRATFAATAAQNARRPNARTALSNLALAGDWTATGLPATIEGAIRSGSTAACMMFM